MEKTVLQLQQENNALREDALNVGNARDMLKRERDMLEERLREYKAEMEAQRKHLEDQLRAANVVDSQLLQAEVDHLKEQLRKKEERDQDISRRLRNGHNQIAQALREQQQAAVKIQSRFRGNQVRKGQQIISRDPNERRQQENAASSIQARFRGN